MEELYLLQQEHQYRDRGSSRMDQVRRDTINEWNSADANVKPIPYLQAHEMLKDLARCFANRSNDKPNVNFQCDLNLMIEANREYLDNPTLSRLCEMVSDLIHR